MTCEQAQERLVDALYGELSEEDGRAFEAHRVGCPACQARWQGLEGTLETARRALAQDDEAPPVRARAAALEAARRAATSATRRPSGSGERPGTWWRRPWVMPAFAAASVMALFVLAREVILRPERILEMESRGPQDESRWAAPPPPRPSEAGGVRGAASPPAAEPPRVEAKTRDRRSPPRRERRLARPAAAPEPLAPARRKISAAEEPAASARAEGASLDTTSAGREAASAPSLEDEPSARAAGALDRGRPFSLDELVRQAERAFEERRFLEAARAYRELLRRFPEHDAAPQWKSRLRQAEGAR